MTKFHSRSILGLLVLLAVTSAVRADQVDDYIRAVMAERHAPGVAVAVIKNGKVVKMAGYGVASVEFNVPVSTETVFEIGSVSKQMTAAAIMLLVEEGKVKLDSPISTYLPNTPESWKDVTVRHLLTHTSGVKSYSSLDGFELYRHLKTDEFIKALSPHPLEFVPGERNIYSNSGFTLLGHIIQTVSGRPYMQFMRERIFTPLGMTKTADRDPQFIVPNRATGYEWSIDHLEGRDGNLTDLMGAGSIVSTISDMVKWDAALIGKNFLKPESRAGWWKQYIFTNGKPSPYGFGWRISDIRGHKLISHTGQTAGFGAANFRYVDDGVTVIVLTNLGEIGLGGQIAARIAKFYAPEISLRAMKSQNASVKLDERIPEYASLGIRQRLSNTISPDVFAADLFRSLSTERAKAANIRLGKNGPVGIIDLVQQETADGKTIYRFRIEIGKRLTLWRYAFDGEGKISEMTLEEEE